MHLRSPGTRVRRAERWNHRATQSDPGKSCALLTVVVARLEWRGDQCRPA
jgi:hypothetical protein